MRATALFPLLALACAHAPPPPADPNAAFHERYARAVAYDQAAEARPQLLALAVRGARPRPSASPSARTARAAVPAAHQHDR
ncbi:MAG: hypothetical protein U1E65_05480 [Myxococcota bacterium]